ncbi:putative zinc finger protein [Orchesella cincta]|uniref:Putative zinc finger protein n=1 Tax=Orchesella cincta TaxID=48709 RepID=A0A1D2MEF9_ORCCI|nr:putative zinc finger protein [Orchesella cincta]
MENGQKRPNEEDSNPNGEGSKKDKNNKRRKRSSSPQPGPSSAASEPKECFFTCHVCVDKCVQFSMHKDLIRHLTTHTDEKPYKCNPSCGYGTDRHENFARHLTKGMHKMSKEEASDTAKTVALKYLKSNTKDKNSLREIPASKLCGAVRKVVLEKCNVLPKPKNWRPTEDFILQDAIGFGTAASNSMPNLEPSSPIVPRNDDESQQQQESPQPDVMGVERQSNERDDLEEEVINLAAPVRNIVVSHEELETERSASAVDPEEMEAEQQSHSEINGNDNEEIIRDSVVPNQDDAIMSTFVEPERQVNDNEQVKVEAMDTSEAPTSNSTPTSVPGEPHNIMCASLPSERAPPNQEMVHEIASVQNDISSSEVVTDVTNQNQGQGNHIEAIGHVSILTQATVNAYPHPDLNLNAGTEGRQLETDSSHLFQVDEDRVDVHENIVEPANQHTIPEIMFLVAIIVSIILWHLIL